MALKANKVYTGDTVDTNRQHQGRGVQLQRSVPCKCCGNVKHRPESCKFKVAVCHACNKRGHIWPVFHTGEISGRPKPANVSQSKSMGGLHSVHNKLEDVFDSEGQASVRPQSTEYLENHYGNYDRPNENVDAIGVYNTQKLQKKMKPLPKIYKNFCRNFLYKIH